jgi:hypothetical protein
MSKAIIEATGTRAAEALEALLDARLVIDGRVNGTLLEVDATETNTDACVARVEAFGMQVGGVFGPFAMR